MKKVSTYFYPILILVGLMMGVLLSGCKKGENNSAGKMSTKATRNQTHPGTPYTAHYHSVGHNEKSIVFGVLADSHIDCANTGDWNDGNQIRNRRVIDDMNYDKKHWLNEENFIVHLGDAINSENVQNIVAFRQFYENDYPGEDGGAIAGCMDNNYTVYSDGSVIKLPVYVNIGESWSTREA